MKVLLTGAYNYTDYQLAKLKALRGDFLYVQEERAKLQLDVKDIDAVVCNGLFLQNDISEFKNLKFIQATSAGTDRLPMDYIKENNISLHNAGGVYSVPMAEFAVLVTLLIYKQSFGFFESQKNKLWQKQRNLLELSDKRVLIVGTGSVGRECAKRFSAFTDNVYGIDLFACEAEYFKNILPMSELENQLKLSDIVVLTLPLTDKTEGLFNKDLFAAMKKSSVIVNLARGKIIVESDLIHALEANEIGGAALDVFETEPLPENSAFWKMPNVIITPHNSFVSDKTQDRLFNLIYNNLKSFIEGDDKQ